MQPGDTIFADGPYGKLILQEDPQVKRYILVATNTGVTRYRSMLNTLSERLKNSSLKVAILLGVRTPEDLLYGKELTAFAEQHQNAEFFAFYTRKQPEHPKFFERAGRVQSLLPELQLNPTEDIVYLCGNPDMVDEMFTALKELGFQNTSVRREKYVFSH